MIAVCYEFTNYLDDPDEAISRRVNVRLQHRCMFTLLTRTEPKTKAPAQHTSDLLLLCAGLDTVRCKTQLLKCPQI